MPSDAEIVKGLRQAAEWHDRLVAMGDPGGWQADSAADITRAADAIEENARLRAALDAALRKPDAAK